jgi:hypothetical protein
MGCTFAVPLNPQEPAQHFVAQMAKGCHGKKKVSSNSFLRKASEQLK